MMLIARTGPRRDLEGAILDDRALYYTTGYTINKEKVCCSILLSVAKVSNDAIDVLCRWHEQIHGLEPRLRVAIIGYEFSCC
jgi:hypothetical protein